MHKNKFKINRLTKRTLGLLMICLVVQLWVLLAPAFADDPVSTDDPVSVDALVFADDLVSADDASAAGDAPPSENLTSIITGSEKAIGSGGESVLPDLFTGTLGYQVPLEVPPGRNGMQPSLALKYRSSNGNGWIGMGWELEAGAIERSTRKGVDYAQDNYVYRRAGGISELVSVGNDGFRLKIESDFMNFQKQADGSFLARDKTGTKYYFGQTANSRIAGLPGTFKWALDRVEDTSGNIITYTYQNDGNGQIYLDHIDYNGNRITFYLEGRDDLMELYTANFMIKTTKRLKYVHVIAADGTYTRSYKLDYTYGKATGRSNLSSVRQFGKGAIVDAEGNMTNESALSKLPEQTFSINDSRTAFEDQKWADKATWGIYSYREINTAVGDFNGDGRSDVLTLNWSWPYVKESKSDQDGNSYFEDKRWPIDWRHYDDGWEYMYIGLGWLGYFTDDARLDLVRTGIKVYVSKSDAQGNGSFHGKRWTSTETGLSMSTWAGDFNGDGQTDVATVKEGRIYVFLSKTDGTDGFTKAIWNTTASKWGNLRFTWIGDFNGDGLPDIATRVGNTIWVHLNRNGSFETKAWSTPAHWGDKDNTWAADFNGDGRTDIATRRDKTVWVNLSKVDASGNNIFEEQVWTSADTNVWGSVKPLVGDFNGDGLPDIATRDSKDRVFVYYSTGAVNPGTRCVTLDPGGTPACPYDNWGFFMRPASDGANWKSVGLTRVGDFDGDGKTDIFTAHNISEQTGTDLNSGNLWVKHSVSFPVDKIIAIDNGMGGHTDIEYTPSTSTRFTNTDLRFPLQLVTKITRNNTEITNIAYEGGYFYMPEKDFRGFHHVTVKGPAGPNNEQQTTETWFHQGNDLEVDVNVPKAAAGFMKGKPYRVRISDESGHVISETETMYAPQISRVIIGSDAAQSSMASTSPWYFNPPARVDTYTCDGNSVTGQCKGTASARHTRTDYAYDRDSSTVFGNLSHEYHYYDNPSDNLTIHRTYAINESKWIVGLPASEQIFQGIGTSAKVAEITYYYDGGVTDCATASTNQYPDRGLLTRTVRWLHYDGEPDAAIEERMAYDSHGNPVCRGDGRNYISKIGYDPSGTFPVSITSPPTTSSPSGLVTTAKYYGVNAVTGQGLYGQTQSITDPNNAITSYEYDPLGRQKKQALPDGTWTSWAYNNFGIAGAQNVRTDTSDGRWTEEYFDGFGRPVQSKTKGLDSKVIATDTMYDSRGAARKTSFPYFYGTETPRYVVTNYDASGRVTRTGQESPAQAIRTLICYNNDVTVKIDPNNHRRREVRDANGRLTTVQEYKGIYTSCDTAAGTPYATTTYQYDVLGNLRFVINAKGNKTEMRYDSAGRKRYMSDPDMGIWTYVYDNNDNLVSRTDAKKQTVIYGYDALNRNTTKKFGANTVVTNFYDEAASGNSKGRLSRMADNSGQTIFNYDTTGRITGSVKTISGASYTLGFVYVNGRLDKITYPDNDTVRYVYYGDGNLKSAGAYVTYSNYDALGRPRNTAYGAGGASSLFTYDDITKRLKSISVLSPKQGLLFDSAYGYDNKGNITAITDNLNKTPPTNVSSETYSIYSGKAHAPVVTGRSFLYDANGNLTGNGLQNIAYNFDNMPLTIGNVSFSYDGNGARVRKTSSGVTTDYIDKLYECTNGVCVKYIYAGDKRVALKSGAVALFFHPDHLGSTAVVTDALGNLAENISYYPFGQTRQDNSPFSVKTDVKHKYTGQELDSETGFYNYGARLYDPGLARFLTPDSIVPDPENPQSFNRYAYTKNDPVNRIDPTGNFDFSFGGWTFCIFGCGSEGGWDYGSRVVNDYTFRDNAVMNFYIAPEARNYNYGSDNGTGPGYANRYSSSPILLATVPGQQYYDNTVNEFRSGHYVSAALNAGALVAEQLMFVASLGTSSVENSTISKFSNTINQGSTKELQTFFPNNQGFLGQTSRQYLLAGDKIDRYGGIGASRFFAPSGTPLGARALPPGSADQALRVFEVMKPFEVEAGRIAPAYGQLGLGMQYRTSVPLEVLLKRGILREIY